MHCVFTGKDVLPFSIIEKIFSAHNRVCHLNKVKRLLCCKFYNSMLHFSGLFCMSFGLASRIQFDDSLHDFISVCYWCPQRFLCLTFQRVNKLPFSNNLACSESERKKRKEDRKQVVVLKQWAILIQQVILFPFPNQFYDFAEFSHIFKMARGCRQEPDLKFFSQRVLTILSLGYIISIITITDLQNCVSFISIIVLFLF